MATIPITQRGLHRLKQELDHLVHVKRPAVIKAIAEAREHGDLKENSEYHAAREEQSFIEARITYIENTVSFAQVIDCTQFDNMTTVIFGSKVRLYKIETEEEVTYRIVGEDEGDTAHGRLSIATPIAKGLIGKAIGDEVTINTPAGPISFEILDITYDNEPIDAE